DLLVAPEVTAHLQVRMRAVEEPVREIRGEQWVSLLHVLLVVGPRMREPRRPRSPVKAKPRGSRATVPRADQVPRVLEIGQPEPLDALAAPLADEARADVVLLAVQTRRLVEAAEGALVDQVHREEGLRVRDGRFLEELRLPFTVADDGDSVTKRPHSYAGDDFGDGLALRRVGATDQDDVGAGLEGYQIGLEPHRGRLRVGH